MIRPWTLCGIEPETATYWALNPSATPAQIAAIDLNIKLIKYGSGITLASVTTNISAVDLTAFLSNPSTDLRPYCGNGWKATITDASAKSNVAILGAVGTGETLGDELITNVADREFTSDTGFWIKSATTSIGSNVLYLNSPSAEWGAYSEILTIHALYSSSVNVVSFTSGYIIVQTGNAISESYISTGTKVNKKTCISNTRFGIAGRVQNGIMDDFSVKQVITPSALGCTLLNAAGAQSFISKDAAFSYSAASYTITITRN